MAIYDNNMHYNMTLNKMVPFKRWTNYHYFCRDNRETVKQNNYDLNFLEINSILGKMWREHSSNYCNDQNNNIKIGNEMITNINIAEEMGIHYSTRNRASWDEHIEALRDERGICDWMCEKGTGKGLKCVRYCKKNSTRCSQHTSTKIQEVQTNVCEWKMRTGPRKGQDCGVSCVTNFCNTHCTINMHTYNKKKGMYPNMGHTIKRVPKKDAWGTTPAPLSPKRVAPDEGTTRVPFAKQYPTWERRIAQAIWHTGGGRPKVASRVAIQKFLIAEGGIMEISYLPTALGKYTARGSFIKVKASYKLSDDLKKRLKKLGDL